MHGHMNGRFIKVVSWLKEINNTNKLAK